ncbi:MAG: NAD-dependent protein deacylase [Candidatus Hinthialibacteria bacterium OLB16]|nr:MAG: NAD-dependent protein deacylase [Candidatus Hinthialibacteria bacterium OLB16]
MAEPSDPLVREVALLLEKKPRISVLTGAGVSAASGIPTFRDAQGLWEGVPPEDVATPQAFARIPGLSGVFMMRGAEGCWSAIPTVAMRSWLPGAGGILISP